MRVARNIHQMMKQEAQRNGMFRDNTIGIHALRLENQPAGKTYMV
jgi:hypothetical protein